MWLLQGVEEHDLHIPWNWYSWVPWHHGKESVLKSVAKCESLPLCVMNPWILEQLVTYIPICDNRECTTHFLSMADLRDGKAETIVSVLKDVLASCELSVGNLSSFGSDGASVMVGSCSSVAAHLCELNPGILNVQGVSHCLALATAQAGNQIEEGERLVGCSVKVLSLLLSGSRKFGSLTVSHATWRVESDRGGWHTLAVTSLLWIYCPWCSEFCTTKDPKTSQHIWLSPADGYLQFHCLCAPSWWSSFCSIQAITCFSVKQCCMVFLSSLSLWSSTHSGIFNAWRASQTWIFSLESKRSLSKSNLILILISPRTHVWWRRVWRAALPLWGLHSYWGVRGIRTNPPPVSSRCPGQDCPVLSKHGCCEFILCSAAWELVKTFNWEAWNNLWALSELSAADWLMSNLWRRSGRSLLNLLETSQHWRRQTICKARQGNFLPKILSTNCFLLWTSCTREVLPSLFLQLIRPDCKATEHISSS